MGNPIIWIGLTAMVVTVGLHFLFNLYDETDEQLDSINNELLGEASKIEEEREGFIRVRVEPSIDGDRVYVEGKPYTTLQYEGNTIHDVEFDPSKSMYTFKDEIDVRNKH